VGVDSSDLATESTASLNSSDVDTLTGSDESVLATQEPEAGDPGVTLVLAVRDRTTLLLERAG
jgi:hypothetical protein